MKFSESILSIGSPTPLQGIMTTPNFDEQTGELRDTTLVLLNAGLLHHVGSCLLSVRLARQAASVGMRAVRVDFSGIGDSAARPPSPNHAHRVIEETCEVLEFLHQHFGSEKFILAGLCSAVHAGFGASLLDERVVGIAGIAPFGYRTRQWYVNSYRSRLLSLDRWTNFARRMVGTNRAEPQSYAAEFLESTETLSWEAPPIEEIRSNYRALLQRDMRFHYTFTSGEKAYYNYEGQMQDMHPDLDFGDALTECYLPDARHILTEPVYQQQVLTQTQEWIDANWP